MKRTYISVAFSLLISLLFCRVWHINNVPDMAANFSDLTLAQAASPVVDGDTLYVYGSPLPYSSITVTKRLTIIGPGYFLNQNSGLQSNIIPATIDQVTFSTGSAGSVISGMSVNYLQVNVTNVVVQRNHLARLYIYASNCVAIQNFINNTPNTNYAISGDGALNFLIANNYICYSPGGWCVYLTDNCGGVFANNITTGSCRLRNTEVYNCIIGWGGNGWEWSFDFDANTAFHHNVFKDVYSWNWYTSVNITGTGNLYNTTNDLYVATGSTDGYYQLNAGSVASGAGANGADCGIFGGLDPYRLSGIPAIPTIYEFFAPSTGFTIPVHIRAKSNN